VLPCPLIHPALPALAALAITHKDRAAPRLKIGLGQHQRLIDPQPSPPKDHDKRADPHAVQARAGSMHDGDDLLNPRWISGKAPALVARNAPALIPKHRRWRSTPTGRVEQLDWHMTGS
jgi:hypothetical protein